MTGLSIDLTHYNMVVSTAQNEPEKLRLALNGLISECESYMKQSESREAGLRERVEGLIRANIYAECGQGEVEYRCHVCNEIGSTKEDIKHGKGFLCQI